MREMKRGFYHKGKMVKYLDPLGKDASFERWRISLYYEPNFAMTHFEPSETAYNQFLTFHAPDCYETYGAYRAAYEAEKGARGK